MSNLTQAQIDAFVENLQTYKYLVSVGETDLGLLKSAPTFEFDKEEKDLVLYASGSEAVAKVISKLNVKLTLETEQFDAAMALIVALKKGDNLLDTDKSVTITMVPVTDETGAKSIVLGNAFLQADSAPTFAEGDDPNTVKLVYLCRPVGTTGKPFTYAA